MELSKIPKEPFALLELPVRQVELAENKFATQVWNGNKWEKLFIKKEKN